MSEKGHNTRAVWANKIRSAWKATIEGICDVGRLLIDAREDLPHGQFEAMVEAEGLFSTRTVRMLMAIGRDQRIRDVQNGTTGAVLPSSWRTLYELTRLTDEQFQSSLNSGAINAEMRRSDVAALCPATKRLTSSQLELKRFAPF